MSASNAAADTEDEPELFAKAEKSEVMSHVCEPRRPITNEFQAAPVLVDEQRRVLQCVQVEPCTVILHVYDLDNTTKAANQLLAFSMERLAMGGAFHVGVEAFGSEWWYGCEGVACDRPRTLQDHVYRCSIVLGKTTMVQWVTELHIMCQSWFGSDYSMFTHNCCCFAAELVQRLGIGPIPPWVDRFSRLLQRSHETGVDAIRAAEKSVRAFKAAGESTEQLLDKGFQQIADKLRSARPGEEAAAITLPNSQIVVQGQRVMRVSSEDGHEASPCFEAPAFVSWSEDAPVLASSPCHQGSMEPSACRQAPGQDASEMLPFDDKCWAETSRGLSNVDGTLGMDNPKATLGLDATICLAHDETQGLPQVQPVGSLFVVGGAAEYYSISQGGWIPATILAFDEQTGLYDLDCKPSVPIHKLRLVDIASSQGPGNPIDSRAPHGSDIEEVTWWPPGSLVEYESVSQDNCWLPATITAYHPGTSLYDLDIKLQVPPHKLRGLEQFPIGANIEYRSNSAEQWIAGQVVTFDSGSGLYDLSCKHMVSRRQIRWPVHGQ
jgi:hypothetical protein